MQWVIPRYTRAEVDRAGIALIESDTQEESAHAIAVVDNWRSSHSYPLHALTTSVRTIVRPVDQNALIAQRLKRMSSIAVKLRRHPQMKLSQMQDIGGSRAVVANVLAIEAFVAKMQKARLRCWHLSKQYDYVASPKTDGYRSVHLVYKYNGKADKAAYNKLRVELQVRSHYQHTWATSLETVDTFTKQALKANNGDVRWQRFFQLMAQSIALREGSSFVPNTPTFRDELIGELRPLVKALKVINTLEGLKTAANVVEQRQGQGHFFLLSLDLHKRRIRIRSFAKTDADKAATEYSLAEASTLNDSTRQTVLVSVNSVAALRIAYPNYYMDTTEFVRLVKEDMLEAHTRSATPHRRMRA